jgi:hypothetical protein
MAVGWLLEVAEPVDPVSPELVQLEPSASPDLAPETVTGFAEAQPAEPPLPEFPDVGFEFTVAGPVAPVDPVSPELPDFAVEPDWPWLSQPWFPLAMPSGVATGSLWPNPNPKKVGAKLKLGPVFPDFPELPELPDVAVLRFELALPVSPELALPDWAVVELDAFESASPLCPPWADPVAELSPEFPEVATGEPVAVADPDLPECGC